jgi:flagellar protein FlaG
VGEARIIMTPISVYSSNLIETAGVVPLVPPRQPTDTVSEVAQVSKAAELAAAARPEVRVEEFTQPTKEVMQRAADQIRGYLTESGRDLNVFVDESAGYYVTTVLNPNNGEVVRQIPADETLRIARNVQEMPGLQGLFVDRRA